MPGLAAIRYRHPMRNGEVSYWWRALGGVPPRRPSLPGPTEADVCIVGGGYTGLWTAYYLAGLRPGLRIVVLEAAVAGDGASQRSRLSSGPPSTRWVGCARLSRSPAIS